MEYRMNHFLKSKRNKLLLSFIVTLVIYSIYALVIFNSIYDEWDYFLFNGKIFSFDLIRYVFFALTLAITIFAIGFKFEWKYILAIFIGQIIGYLIFYYSAYLHAGKIHYIGDMNSVTKIEHNSFLEWLDFLVGIKRWGYTRLVELTILFLVSFFLLKLPKPKWSLLSRNVYNIK